MVRLLDDRLFWSERIREHMLFIYWYVHAKNIKQQAVSFYNRWKKHITLNDLELLSLMGDTLEFQQQIQVILNDRRWIGAFYPAWMEHITEELEYAIDKVAGNDISDEEEILFWDDVVHDHAGLDARMLDLSERPLINTATVISDRAQTIMNRHESLSDAQLLSLSLQNIENIIQFHENAERSPPKSIIHPLLLHHVQQEEKRGRMIMNIIRNRMN